MSLDNNSKKVLLIAIAVILMILSATGTNIFSLKVLGQTPINDTVTLIAGSNTTLVQDTLNSTITINSLGGAGSDNSKVNKSGDTFCGEDNVNINVYIKCNPKNGANNGVRFAITNVLTGQQWHFINGWQNTTNLVIRNGNSGTNVFNLSNTGELSIKQSVFVDSAGTHPLYGSGHPFIGTSEIWLVSDSNNTNDFLQVLSGHTLYIGTSTSSVLKILGGGGAGQIAIDSDRIFYPIQRTSDIGTEGGMYYNTITGCMRFKNASAWNNFTSSRCT